MSKRSSSPSISLSTTGVHAMRRGGVRREVTERVKLQDAAGNVTEGWALNVSRGGLRVVLEQQLVLGQLVEVTIGTDEVLRRRGRVVWMQEEPDGVIVGFELLDSRSTAPPPGDRPGDNADRTGSGVEAKAFASAAATPARDPGSGEGSGSG